MVCADSDVEKLGGGGVPVIWFHFWILYILGVLLSNSMENVRRLNCGTMRHELV